VAKAGAFAYNGIIQRQFCDRDRKRTKQIFAKNRPTEISYRSTDPAGFCFADHARRIGSQAEPDGLVRERWNMEVR
jgi:hypothetical protein